MNKILEMMIQNYNPQNNIDRENAIKEVVQEIILMGLSRGGFFKKACFYGGTCLRIFYGLERFSEDLDFALIDKSDFDLKKYFPYVKKELQSYGLDMEITSKVKKEGEIESAFVKGNTLITMMNFFPNNEEVRKIVPNERIKIKFEVDLENPDGGTSETKYPLLPIPHEVKAFDKQTLFAGKIHAILCREYKNNIKGRDYYDYLFFCKNKVKINLKYLENKLKHTKKIKENEELTIEKVKAMLKEKFETVNFDLIKKDVYNFIVRKDEIDFWSKELFVSTLDKLS